MQFYVIEIKLSKIQQIAIVLTGKEYYLQVAICLYHHTPKNPQPLDIISAYVIVITIGKSMMTCGRRATEQIPLNIHLFKFLYIHFKTLFFKF